MTQLLLGVILKEKTVCLLKIMRQYITGVYTTDNESSFSNHSCAFNFTIFFYHSSHPSTSNYILVKNYSMI